MKNAIVIGAGALIMTALAGVYLLLQLSPFPDWESIWVPENVLLIDSVAIAESRTAYRFAYDTGAFGYSIVMISLDTPSHTAAIIASDYIRGVEWRPPDTLIVVLSRDVYQLPTTSPDVRLIVRIDSLGVRRTPH